MKKFVIFKTLAGLNYANIPFLGAICPVENTEVKEKPGQGMLCCNIDASLS